MERANNSVVCFGEILWDNLPTGKKAGGAPMNVAYHLHQLGIDGLIISRVGSDKQGNELLQLLNSRGLSTVLCQFDQQYPTSEVLVHVSENHEVSYEIVYPVAWDFTEWEDKFEPLIAKADAFVFGSLITRSKISRDVLYRMLEIARYRVLDINLRSPHYTPETISDLLYKTDLLKLNNEELNLVGQWFAPGDLTETELIKILRDKFNIKEILVTRGSHGASYFSNDIQYDHEGYNVEVADTVGSGDAFLAGFLAKKLNGEALDIALDYACILGAFVATHSGACPAYNPSGLEQFISKKNTNKIQDNQMSI
jgi:fructokinase